VAAALTEAVGHHPRTALLHRAIESYRRAVGHWVPEERLLAGEFLFIATETLSRFLIESRAHEAGRTPKNLARSKRLDPEACVPSTCRTTCSAQETMHDARDGFEHGYMAVDDVRAGRAGARALDEPRAPRAYRGLGAWRHDVGASP